MTTTNPFEPTGSLKNSTGYPTDSILIFKAMPQNKFHLIFSNTVFLQSTVSLNQQTASSELAEVLDDDLADLFREKMNQCINEHSEITFQHCQQKLDQQTNWVTQILCTVSEQDKTKRVICISRNISKPEMVEEDFVNNKILLTRLFETSQMGMMITDSRGLIIECNKGAEKDAGLSRGELLQLNIATQNKREFYTEDYIAIPITATPAVKALHEKTIIKNVINGIKEAGNEEIKWLNISAAYIGSIGYGVIVITQNITAEVLQQQQMATLENNLQTIISSSPDMIIFIDPELKIAFTNEAAESGVMKLTGKELIKGNNFIDYIPYEKRATALQILSKALKEEIPFDEDLIFEENLKKWIQVKCTPVYNNLEKHIGYIITIADITERKEEELRIKKQNSQLREIAKIQSHELRRPLANILGLVELLKNEAEKEVDKTLLSQLELSACNLDDVIKKITQRTVIS